MHLAFAILWLAVQTAAPPKVAIEGVVLRAGSDEAVSNARVDLIPGSGGAATLAPTHTDERGRFRFEGVEPGPYRIVAARNGFVRQEYGQRPSRREGVTLTLRPGQALNDIVFKLAATGAVSGRVVDSGGQPLTGANVVLMRALYDSEGVRTVQPVIGTRTDDRGEYRLFWITPGRYYVNANMLRSFDELSLNNPASGVISNVTPRSDGVTRVAEGDRYNVNGVIDQGYASTYYGNTADPNRAVAIAVQTGNEIAGINLVLPRQNLVRIRGRLVDGAYGQAPRRGSVTLNANGTARPLSSYDQRTGEFEIRDVPPGPYELVATMLAPNPSTTANTTLYMRLDVPGTDIDNLVLTIGPHAAFQGRFVMEPSANSAGPSDFGGIALRIPLATNSVLGRYVRIAPDGGFSATEVPSGEYRFAIYDLPPTVFVKSISLGRTDISQQSFKLPLSTPGSFEILLSPTAGQLSGMTAPDAQVALIPGVRTRHDLYKSVIADHDGRFALNGIAPGDYQLFAWEDIEPNSFHDPEVLREYENKGKSIRIVESSKQTSDIPVIAR
jgi:hypothetical protein